ncbi:MAG: MauE/DoxX family redox-associated membrane protein, partial [Thermodesulfobacteriota bacterium]
MSDWVNTDSPTSPPAPARGRGTFPGDPPWPLVCLLGTVLGGVFFYAGVQKHLAPYDFAEAVLAYQLVPARLVGAVAAILPWLEITPAFFLLLGYLLEAPGRLALKLGYTGGAHLVGGIKRRSCLLLIMLQLVLFMLVLLITMARGLKIDCGCGLFFERQVGWVALLEDAFFLAWTGLLWRWDFFGGGGQGPVAPAP